MLADGLPYVFDEFSYERGQMQGDGIRLTGKLTQTRNEIPLQNFVLRFP